MTTNKPRQKTSRVTYWVMGCTECGREFEVVPSNPEKTCPLCRDKAAVDKAIKAIEWMVGAEVTKVELCGADEDELERVLLRAKDGSIFELTAEGWDERYIGWDWTDKEPYWGK